MKYLEKMIKETLSFFMIPLLLLSPIIGVFYGGYLAIKKHKVNK